MASICRCDEHDFPTIWEIVNDGAQAYKEIIPADRWTEPYMSREKLAHEMDARVVFWGYKKADGNMVAVMGIQQVEDVTLLRHAYVRSDHHHLGIGGRLFAQLRALAHGPVLIGTWADAVRAIGFYEKHGFRMVSVQEKVLLLKRYWTLPDRQIETSVVLVEDPTRV